MTIPLAIVFSLCFGLMVYIYQGYAWVLRWLPLSKKQWQQEGPLPSVTLLITAYNEEAVIEAKLANAVALDYPAELLEILVASDGSTDETDALVTAFAQRTTGPKIRLFRPENPIGKTDTQNKAIATAAGDILVFTDAETRFEPQFLAELVKPFADERVGGVDGHLLFELDGDSGISQNQGFYWQYELTLRQRESDMGLLAVASGACMAIRTGLFEPMVAAYGEDCIVPLSIVAQGYAFVHQPTAVAVDRMASTQRGEFRTRVRMTLRNWQGTWSRPALLNPFKHTGYAFALWSHKLLRWLSPVFLLAMTGLALVLALVLDCHVFQVVALAIGGFYLMAALGWWHQRGGPRLPLVNTAYSFLLANLGFLVGVWRGITGHKVTRYQNPS